MSESGLKFRAVELADLETLYRWENDFETWQVSLSKVPYSRFQLEQYIAHANEDIQNAGQYRFMIEAQDGGLMGCVDLFDYETVHRRAGVGILIDKAFRHKGYASQALSFIVDYAFSKLGMKQLYCSISSDNKASLDLFKKASFEEIGLRQDWIFIEGEWKDVIDFQLLNK